MLGNNIVKQFFTQSIGLISGFSTSIITSRILGPEGRGDLALIINTSAFLCLILGLNFGSSIIYIIASKKMPYKNLINTANLFILTLIILCLFILFILPFNKYFELLPHSMQNSSFYKWILIILFTISIYSTLFNAILTGKKLFGPSQKNYILYYVISIVSYLFLFVLRSYFKIDLNSFLIFYCLITFTLTLGAFLICLKHSDNYRFTFKLLSKSQLKYLLNFSIIAYAAAIFHFLCVRMDFWFIDYYRGSSNLGLYSLASNLSQMLWILPQAIASILIAHTGSDTTENGIKNTNVLSRATVTIVFSIAVLLFFTVDFFIPFFFGDKFKGSVILFKLLLIGTVPFCITTIISSYFIGKGKIILNLQSSFIGFIICLFFDIILIPKYGNIGAAMASGIAYFFNTVFMIIFYLKETKTHLYELLIITKTDIALIKQKLPILNRL